MSSVAPERQRDDVGTTRRKAHWTRDNEYGICGAKLLGIPATSSMPVCEECARLRDEHLNARRES